LALFGLAPVIGSACEYSVSMGTAATPAQLALAPAPEATQEAKVAVAKVPAPKTAKQALGNVTEPAPDAKLAMAPTNQAASTTLRSPPGAGFFVAIEHENWQQPDLRHNLPNRFKAVTPSAGTGDTSHGRRAGKRSASTKP
jgi:hypothetical protein